MKTYYEMINGKLREKIIVNYGKPIVIVLHVIIIILVNAFYIILLNQTFGKNDAIREIIDFGIRTLISTGLIFLALAIYWRFIEIPKEIFIEMKEIIDKNDKRLTNINIQIELFPRIEEEYASIRVINNGDEDIDDCVLLLVEISKLENGAYINKTLEINPDNAYISQGARDRRESIKGKNYTTYNLAKIEREELFLLFTEGIKRKINQGIYRLIIEFGGKINRININRISRQLYLEFIVKYVDVPIIEGNMKGQIEIKQGVYLDIRETEMSLKEINSYSLVSFLSPSTRENILEILRRKNEKK